MHINVRATVFYFAQGLGFPKNKILIQSIKPKENILKTKIKTEWAEN